MNLADMSVFGWIVLVAFFLIGACVLAGIVLIIRTKDDLARAVMADLVFYGMIAMYVVWSMNNDSSITYDIVLMAAVTAGVLPTLSMARIISKGRR